MLRKSILFLFFLGIFIPVFNAKAIDRTLRYVPEDIEVLSTEAEDFDESMIKVGSTSNGEARYLGRFNLREKANTDVDVEDATFTIRAVGNTSNISLEAVTVVSNWEINKVSGFNALSTGNRAVAGETTVLNTVNGKVYFEVTFDFTDFVRDWFSGNNNGFMIRARSGGVTEVHSAQRVLGTPFLIVNLDETSLNNNNNNSSSNNSNNFFDPGNIDLIVKSVSLSKEALKGQKYDGNVVVRLRNTGESSVSFRDLLIHLFVYEAGNQRFLNGAVEFANGSISAKSERDIIFSPSHFEPPLLFNNVNQVEFVAEVDVNDAIDELIETNNKLSSGIVVLKEGFQVGDFCENNLRNFAGEPSFENFSRGLNITRNLELENTVINSKVNPLKQGVSVNSLQETFAKFFISYGCDRNSILLGVGERAAVLASYKQAFNNLPLNLSQMRDAVLIANGRVPSQRSLESERIAITNFNKVYLRDPNFQNKHDQNAIHVFAYGLRQVAENRRLGSESNSLNTFKSLYGRIPLNTIEWNLVQGIAYSGARR